jgi:hypothetical protein
VRYDDLEMSWRDALYVLVRIGWHRLWHNDPPYGHSAYEARTRALYRSIASGREEHEPL